MTQKTLYLGHEPEQFTPGQELVLESFFEQSPYGVISTATSMQCSTLPPTPAIAAMLSPRPTATGCVSQTAC